LRKRKRKVSSLSSSISLGTIGVIDIFFLIRNILQGVIAVLECTPRGFPKRMTLSSHGAAIIKKRSPEHNRYHQESYQQNCPPPLTELPGLFSAEITIASLDIDIVAFSRIPFNLNMEYTYKYLMLVIYTKINGQSVPATLHTTPWGRVRGKVISKRKKKQTLQG
jgi:hypothetical protein